MTASEAKEIADKINAESFEKTANELIDFVLVAISERADNGNYNLEYEVINCSFSEVTQLKNKLLKLGYSVAIKEDKDIEDECYILNIDWSVEYTK
jgi:hypothetical protein